MSEQTRRIPTRPVLAALVAACLWSPAAHAQIAVSSNDNKAVWVNGVNTVPANPKPDTVSVIDLGATPPRVLAEIEVPGGWSAPPQSVAVAPDESIALVASGARLDPANPARTVFNDVLSVIDLKATPPAVVATLQTGRRAAGVSINPAGTLALVANRAEGTVSVFSIAGRTVTPVGKVDLGAPDSEPSLPVFTPDGRTALVTLNNGHRVAMLSIDGVKVEYTKTDIAAGLRPYGIDVAPSGTAAVVANIGNGPTGGSDTLQVIDLTMNPPRVVDGVFVGIVPEGMAISPDGGFVAVAIQNGAQLARTAPQYHENGILKIYRLTGTKLTYVTEAKVGRWAQGIAWNDDGNVLLVQSAADNTIEVFSFTGRELKPATPIKIDGAPTGIRTAERRQARQSRLPALSLEGRLHAGQPGEVKFEMHRPAGWNGTLVLDLDFTTSWSAAQRRWFLDRGYAIGGTHRNQNESGYDIRAIVDNQLEIRRLLTERGVAPSRTIAFGVSRGGIVARAMIDSHPEVFDAALIFAGGGAGVVGYLQSKLDAMFALKMLVDPSSTLPLVNVPRPMPGGAAETALNALMTRARSTPQGRARLTLAAAFDQQPRWSIVRSPKPAADDLDAQATHMQAGVNYNQGPRWQAEVLNGGNVSWNHGVDYRVLLENSGVADVVRKQYRDAGLDLDADLDTLARAPRIAADPAVIARAERNYSYTGKIGGPVLSIKTVGDPADPPSSDLAFAQTLERAGTRDLLRMAYIERPGHSTQSVLEKVAAFEVLMERLESGRWTDQPLPGLLNAVARGVAEHSDLDLGDSRFIAFRPAAPLRTWDFSNFGTYRPPADRTAGGTAAAGRPAAAGSGLPAR